MRNIILALGISLFTLTGVQAGENPFKATAKTSESQVAMGKKDKKKSCDGKKKASCDGKKKKGSCSGNKKGSCGGSK